MRKITTEHLLKQAKRNILLIIIPALLVFGLVLAKTSIKDSKNFEATSMLMVTGESKDEAISYNNIILNEKLANIYSNFLESSDLYDAVGKKLGEDYDPEGIKSKLDYEVNPQGGVISFSYKDTNEDRASDTLTLITEEFRTYALNFLNIDNIEYLQKTKVDKPSKIKGIIFSILGLLAGALLGILITIIKEILTDRIRDAKDIEDLGIRVLGDLTKDSKAAIYKTKASIDYLTENSVIGITSLDPKKSTYDFTEKLALAMSKSFGLCLIDSLAENKVVDKKYESNEEDIKLIRYKGVDFIKLREKSLDILDSYVFEDKIYELRDSYNYVLINESNIDSLEATIGLRYEDYRIVVANDPHMGREDLVRKINSIEDMGCKVLGVIYDK